MVSLFVCTYFFNRGPGVKNSNVLKNVYGNLQHEEVCEFDGAMSSELTGTVSSVLGSSGRALLGKALWGRTGLASGFASGLLARALLESLLCSLLSSTGSSSQYLHHGDGQQL